MSFEETKRRVTDTCCSTDGNFIEETINEFINEMLIKEGHRIKKGFDETIYSFIERVQWYRYEICFDGKIEGVIEARSFFDMEID